MIFFPIFFIMRKVQISHSGIFALKQVYKKIRLKRKSIIQLCTKGSIPETWVSTQNLGQYPNASTLTRWQISFCESNKIRFAKVFPKTIPWRIPKRKHHRRPSHKTIPFTKDYLTCKSYFILSQKAIPHENPFFSITKGYFTWKSYFFYHKRLSHKTFFSFFSFFFHFFLKFFFSLLYHTLIYLYIRV